MDPTPVGVNHDLAVLRGACIFARALLPSHGRVRLCLVCPDLLATDKDPEGEENCKTAIHRERIRRGKLEEESDGESECEGWSEEADVAGQWAHYISTSASALLVA